MSRPVTLLSTLAAAVALAGIDVRPVNGMVYGLGVDASADTGTLYVIGPPGFAGAVGTPGAVAMTTNGATAVDLPTGEHGFDVNPVADRIRVTAANTGLNFRINPNTGAPVDGDNGGGAGTVTGVNPDGAINGATTTVGEVGYTNAGSAFPATTT